MPIRAIIYRPSSSVRIRYGMALTLFLAALVLTKLSISYFDKTPNALFICAVILSGWFGGLGPGLLTGMLSVLAIYAEYTWGHLLIYSFSAFVVSWISGKQKRAQESLQEARDQLEAKVQERTRQLQRINDELLRSETYLAHGQRLSQTGSWAWNVTAQENVYWSKEHFSIYGFEPKQGIIPYTEARQRIHPEDRLRFEESFRTALREQKDFEVDHRIILPDGSTRHVHVLGHPIFNEKGVPVEYIGTIMDVTDRKLSEETLRKTEADLARVARITTVGELTASIAHEVNQPLAAIVTNGNACLRWLEGCEPDLDETRAAARRIITDGNRASNVIIRIRALLKKGESDYSRLDLNEVISGTLALAKGSVTRQRATIKTELDPKLPATSGDVVQLQQVLLNLIMNALDAMEAVVDRPKLILIRTQRFEEDQVLVSVTDSGPGLDPKEAENLFKAFFTTKSKGLGMGLSISHSIIERHGGRLWTEPGPGPGATFQFTLPAT